MVAFYIFLTILFINTNEIIKSQLDKLKMYLYSFNNKMIDFIVEYLFCPYCSTFIIISIISLNPFIAMFYGLITHLYMNIIEKINE